MSTLNNEQLKAVEKIDGPVRIVAGPGSGKTRTIIHKISHIIDGDFAKPHEVLAITFTNKAAAEMKERAAKLLGNERVPRIFTYHAFSALFLRVEGANIDIGKDYEILDTSDQKRIFKQLMKKRKIIKEELTISDVYDFIKIYRHSESRFEKDKSIGHGLEYEKAMLYYDYQEEKRKINALDFDDLITKVAEVLEQYPEISDHWTNKYKYIFIDEFQDTDNFQYRILKNLTRSDSNITIVGDPDQNIYSWRGANLNLFMNFSNDYPSVEDIHLKQNYRSTPEIVEVAQSLIKKNKKRFEVSQFTENLNGDQVGLYEARTNKGEAEWVSNKIDKLIKLGDKPSDIAVIYRNNAQSSPIEYELGAKGIKYKVVGGFRFYDRKNIKEVINFLTFLIKKDDYSFEQIINIPTRGIGPVSLQKLKNQSFSKMMSMFEFLSKNDVSNLSLRKLVHESLKVLHNWKDKKANHVSIFRKYLDNIGYLNLYSSPEKEDRLKEIDVLLEQLEDFTNKSELPFEESVIEFKQSTSLMSSSDEVTEEGMVTLLTGHSSKGLEFKNVFVIGAKEGIIPHFMNDDIEEERRLFYVMITRAMKKLFVSYFVEETFKSRGSLVSRFIRESNLVITEYNRVDGNNNVIEVDVPEGFKNTSEADKGDLAFHLEFGKGIILNLEDGIATIAFDKAIGVKDLLLGHKSLMIKGK